MASPSKQTTVNNIRILRYSNGQIQLNLWSHVVACLAIHHHTFEEKRIAHDRVEGGLVLPCISETFVPLHVPIPAPI